MAAKSQSDLVAQSMEPKEAVSTVKLRLPGIETLHHKTRQEVAEVLANVLKSHTGVQEIKYVIGKYVELTCLNP